MDKIKSIDYWLADLELQKLVSDICNELRPDLDPQPKIVCGFRGITSFVGGKIQLAKIKKIGIKENVIHSYRGGDPLDFYIEIGNTEWGVLSELQQEAVIFHELLHIEQCVDGKEIKFKLRKHDIEEFSEVVKEYGFYLDDVQEFIENTRDCGEVRQRPRIRRNLREVI
jgi:hypothetical protein